MSDLVFSFEPLADVWDEMIVNARLHWDETEMAKAGEQFAPSFSRYAQYGDAYTVFTARDDGRLVGHCGMYLVASMHSQKMLATEDTWYLLPEYRKGRNAIRFHQFVADEMRQRGAEKITMTAAPYNGACRIMEYLGYTLDCYKYSLDLLSRHGCPTGAVTTDTVMESDHVRTIPAASP